MATVGRDPSSDLVLNDPKCSRRHAVIEAGPDGVTVRDSGSANGVFVNGKKTERARVREGDVVKLGDVAITLLPEETGTVVLETLEALHAPAATREPDRARTVPPPRVLPRAMRSAGDAAVDAPAGPGHAPPGAVDRPRPLTVTVLAVLWILSVPLYAIGGLALAWPARGAGRVGIALGSLALTALSAAMAVGLWQRRRWAHGAQLGIAAIGLFVCPFSLASIAVLVYVLRPAVQWHFSDRQAREPEGVGQAETMFTGALVAAVVLGVLLTAALTFLARTARTVAGGPRSLLVRTPPAQTAAVAQLRGVAAAEDAFHSVCNTGYGDLDALRRPATVIKDYPSEGPAFLRGRDFEQAERDGYRYALTVEEEMPPAAGCPVPRYRRYLYAATPLGAGRWLVVGPDGIVRAAEGRPATLEDPPAP